MLGFRCVGSHLVWLRGVAALSGRVDVVGLAQMKHGDWVTVEAPTSLLEPVTLFFKAIGFA